jgi:O-antigen/teichoic acid export membrane protein
MSRAGVLLGAAIDRTQASLRGYGREAGLVLAARVLQNINGFLLSVLIVRRFGLPAAGTLAVATVATVVIALVGTFGLVYVFARTDAPEREKNALGLMAAWVVIPLSLPFVIALGLLAGRNPEEAAVIALLSMGGPFFAQANVANALQVLHGRAWQSIIPPAANFIGLIAAAGFGSSYLMFASLLALFRFAGTFSAFFVMPRTRISFNYFWTHVRAGAHFLTADILNLGSDQLTVLLASYVMSRADLGLFGLCRQMLTVSDTPGWSQIQAKFPAMVSDPARAFPELRRTMPRLGAFCALGVAVLTAPLGLFVYRSTQFMVLAPLLLSSVPLRYLLTVYDAHLRAIGAVMKTNRVSLIRAVLALIIIPASAWFGGALGAILGTMVHTAVSVFLTRRVSMIGEAPAIERPAAEGAAAG